MMRPWLFSILLFLSAAPAEAQEPSPALRGGAERVVALLKGEATPADVFTPAFLADVPEAQIRAISAQFAAQYGAVRGLAGVDTASPQSGTIHIAYERATVHLNLVVEAAAPYRVTGLLLTDADVTGDSIEAILAEARALPGQVAIAVARLGEGEPVLTWSLAPDRPLAIGSTFKLFILAELSRQVRAGRRRWSDVVALDRRSLPGGIIHGWPRGAPVTLHSLAALMISISDNSATDILLHTLGRENVERTMARIGVRDPARNRPLLSTLEASALKTGPAAALNLWLQADEAGRRRMLANEFAQTDAERIDISRFTGNPLHIERVEWFASPADLVRVMDWLRREGDDGARAILAINSGLAPQARRDFAYLGYKGGSEPGVLSLTWLVRTRAGAWHVISASWNDSAAPLDEARLTTLMARAVQLLR